MLIGEVWFPPPSEHFTDDTKAAAKILLESPYPTGPTSEPGSGNPARDRDTGHTPHKTWVVQDPRLFVSCIWSEELQARARFKKPLKKLSCPVPPQKWNEKDIDNADERPADHPVEEVKTPEENQGKRQERQRFEHFDIMTGLKAAQLRENYAKQVFITLICWESS
uniref:Uncharacterized protein n=1 Tax=Riboviria sp. TaxID=2585031 RepID=A0A514D3K8_9VIRU|nr:MAG: hypothetical protein H4Bulk471966_000002 [Riboviria sp.]